MIVPAAEKPLHVSQPGAHVVQGGLVLLYRRRVVLALVLPNVTMYALGIAQIGHQEADVRGPAVIRPPSARQRAQAVIGGCVSAPVGVIHTETLRARGHKASPGVPSDSQSPSSVRFARPKLT